MLLLKKISSSLLISAAIVASININAEELKLAHFAPVKYPLHEGMFVPLSEGIAKETNKATTIRIYPGGELGPGPDKQYDRVVDGVADIGYGLPGYTASQFPMTLLMEVPGVIMPDTGTQALWKNIEQLNGEFKRVKLLGIWNNPESVLMTKDKPIKSLDDLKGLKIRVSSRNVGDLLTAWGASPVSMPITEVYNSMSTGVIDGVYTDASVLQSFKLNEVSKYVTKGMHSALSPQFLIMNRDSWDGLDEASKAAMTKLTGVEMSETGRKIQADHATSALKAFTESSKEVITLSEAEAAKFNAASAQLLDKAVADLEAKGVKAKDFVTALKQ